VGQGTAWRKVAVPDDSNPEGGSDVARGTLALGLLAIALAYVNTLRFQFVYDDLPQIVNNPLVHSWRYAPRYFVEHVWSQIPGLPGTYYRPVFLLWLRLNHACFGLAPFPWHLTTLLVHLAVTLLVYRLLLRVTADRLTAAFAAVLFGLHPTHIETVAWISGVTDSLTALFLLASFLCYCGWRDGRRTAWMAASLLLYTLALLTKETALGLPLLLLAYEWLLPPDGRAPAAGRWRFLLRGLVPYLVTAAAYMVVRSEVLRGLGYGFDYSSLSLLLSVPSVIWFYLARLVWPVHLSVFYDPRTLTTPGLFNFVLPLLGVAGVAGVLFWLARRSRPAAFASLWFAVLMLPPLIGIYTFLPEEQVHDRYLYLPSVGFALLLALGLRCLPSGRRRLFGQPAASFAGFLLLAGLFGAGTALQNVNWANNLTLFARGVTAAPHNFLPVNLLANEMFRHGRVTAALELYQHSLELKPDEWTTHFALGITQFETGDYQGAERSLQRATQIRSGDANQFYYLGLAQSKLGRWQAAEDSLRSAIARSPRGQGFHLALGIALQNEGRPAEAREEFRTELRNYPDSPARQRLNTSQQ
jgi:Flp pilus assembly protein TadD